MQQTDREGGHKHNDSHGKRDLEHRKEFCPQAEHLRVTQTKLCVAAKAKENIVPELWLPILPTGHEQHALGKSKIETTGSAVTPGARSASIDNPEPGSEKKEVNHP